MIPSIVTRTPLTRALVALAGVATLAPALSAEPWRPAGQGRVELRGLVSWAPAPGDVLRVSSIRRDRVVHGGLGRARTRVARYEDEVVVVDHLGRIEERRRTIARLDDSRLREPEREEARGLRLRLTRRGPGLLTYGLAPGRDLPGPLLDAIRHEASHARPEWALALPERAVGVGEEWHVAPALLAALLPELELDLPGRGSFARGALLSLVEGDEGPIATVRLRGELVLTDLRGFHLVAPARLHVEAILWGSPAGDRPLEGWELTLRLGPAHTSLGEALELDSARSERVELVRPGAEPTVAPVSR